jgi:hypothetical protein
LRPKFPGFCEHSLCIKKKSMYEPKDVLQATADISADWSVHAAQDKDKKVAEGAQLTMTSLDESSMMFGTDIGCMRGEHTSDTDVDLQKEAE